MKRILLTLLLLCSIVVGVQAMSYDDARRQAWFLTDKMAYELNLTPDQYDRAYEINLDYFMSIRTPSDCMGPYWSYRDLDLRCVLFDWQYNLYCTLDYFFRPVRWVQSRWYYPVTHRYRYGYYYFDRPTIYVSYRGGGWRRRSHNDRSPYYGMHFDRGHGMRDRYDSGSWGRPGNGKRPGNGFKPGRPDSDKRPGDQHKPSRPGNGNNSGRPGGNVGNNRPDVPGHNARPNNPSKDNGSQGRPGRPSSGNGSGHKDNGITVVQRPHNGNNNGVQRPGSSNVNKNPNRSQINSGSFNVNTRVNGSSRGNNRVSSPSRSERRVSAPSRGNSNRSNSRSVNRGSTDRNTRRF